MGRAPPPLPVPPLLILVCVCASISFDADNCVCSSINENDIHACMHPILMYERTAVEHCQKDCATAKLFVRDKLLSIPIHFVFPLTQGH